MIIAIRDHLFLGDQADAEYLPQEITALLWAASDSLKRPPPHILLARLPLKEYTEPDIIDLQGGVDWLVRHLPKHKILVACRAGMGRSASVILAYLCCVENLSYQAALKELLAKHPNTSPLPHLERLIHTMKASKPA